MDVDDAAFHSGLARPQPAGAGSGGGGASAPAAPAAAARSAPAGSDRYSFLMSLSADGALRYKLAQAASIPADMICWMLADHIGGPAAAAAPAAPAAAASSASAAAGAGAASPAVAPLDDDARHDLSVVLGATTKAVAIALCEAAVAARDAEAGGADGAERGGVEERHIAEAWRALVSEGVLPGSATWPLGDTHAAALARAGLGEAAADGPGDGAPAAAAAGGPRKRARVGARGGSGAAGAAEGAPGSDADVDADVDADADGDDADGDAAQQGASGVDNDDDDGGNDDDR